jgi:hypothetical protein
MPSIDHMHACDIVLWTQCNKNTYPFLRIHDLMDSLSGAKVFPSHDFKSGYHQLTLYSSDVEDSAFDTPGSEAGREGWQGEHRCSGGCHVGPRRRWIVAA